MRQWLIVLATVCSVVLVKLVYADATQKETGIEKQLSQIAARLDAIVQNQAKLDTIITNQETMLQMLRIIRHR